MPEEDAPLSLTRQTVALGRLLKSVSDEDPSGTPTLTAATAFVAWLAEAGPGGRRPEFFVDVMENYDICGNSCKDLWTLFHMLEGYIEMDEDEMPMDEPRTFIKLPLLGGESKPSSE